MRLERLMFMLKISLLLANSERTTCTNASSNNCNVKNAPYSIVCSPVDVILKAE